MKKLFILAALFTGSAIAGTFAEYDFDFQNNQTKGLSNHETHAFSVMTDVTSNPGLSAGVRAEIENEQGVDAVQGLIQGQVKYNILTYTGLGIPLTPYVTAAFGEKMYLGRQFDFGQGGIGVSAKLTNRLTLDVAGRYRNGFEAKNQFESNETSVKLAYQATENQTVALRGAFERGQLNYNIIGATYQYHF